MELVVALGSDLYKAVARAAYDFSDSDRFVDAHCMVATCRRRAMLALFKIATYDNGSLYKTR